ncbi:hypothetical protein JI735_34715 (plasmid) [Paenibacillus sonchi]|uniref:Uncharacterized protein n=1 Tax=Paenibacillus sonchi TaxID=373687 RepID=A0A974PJR5_9BACL|nr:hypothetical protein [Paenibacillus sonchi]QQZ64582.1 hypothetical protein JI735_34715 [Paenibacillus sonchi]
MPKENKIVDWSPALRQHSGNGGRIKRRQLTLHCRSILVFNIIFFIEQQQKNTININFEIIANKKYRIYDIGYKKNHFYFPCASNDFAGMGLLLRQQK